MTMPNQVKPEKTLQGIHVLGRENSIPPSPKRYFLLYIIKLSGKEFLQGMGNDNVSENIEYKKKKLTKEFFCAVCIGWREK
jgi:hypothetical protein